MPLVQSLDILRRRVTNPVFKAVLDDVYERVRAGSSLSEAFEAHGALFPGRLHGVAPRRREERQPRAGDPALRRLREGRGQRQAEDDLRAGLSGDPAGCSRCVVVSHHRAAGRARVRRVLRRSSARSCRSRRGSSSRSRRSRRRYFLPIVIVVALVGGRASGSGCSGPASGSGSIAGCCGCPGSAAIAQKFATSQAARTLATLLGGGIPLVNAIDVSARSIRNQYMAHELRSAAQQVREGRALASAMSDSGAFPDVAIKMVEVGESTGALQEMLNSLADFYDEEIETNLGRFVTLVEPILLIVMGLVIAGLLLSLYMPLFNLSNALR